VSDKDNGAPGTLGNIGKAAEHGAHFVCPVHIGLFAHIVERHFLVDTNSTL
jgi:hypothetical protein